ncbi:MAG: hypothetical protein Q8P53_03625 [Candidatus Shapirobacteria bacterium]|nr:hypothetical protein [Candidatus Shapirobacteria bacterium]
MTPDLNNPIFFALIQKLFLIFLSVFYFIFAIIITKQISILSKSIKDKFNSILITVSYVHLFFSFLLIVLAFL